MLSTYWCNRIWVAESNGYISAEQAEQFCNSINTDNEMCLLMSAKKDYKVHWCKVQGIDLDTLDNLIYGLDCTF